MEYKYKEYNQFVQDATKAGYVCKHSEGDGAPFIVCENIKIHVVLGQISVRCNYFCVGTEDEGYKIMPFKPETKRPTLNPEDEEIDDTI